MQYFISHRGNLFGPDKSRENHPDYIKEAMILNFHVEVDVWLIKNQLFLGHDEPQYMINKYFLQNEMLWCHAKNLAALNFMLTNNIHCFWHQEDDACITSKGFIWTHPNTGNIINSIKLDFNKPKLKWNSGGIIGICSDYISDYRDDIEFDI